MSVGKVMSYLELRKFPKFFAEAGVRAQAHPTLEISCGPETICIPPRSRGIVMGSRVAVALGRIPVLDTMARVIPELKSKGVQVAVGRYLGIGACVDNIYTMACTGNDAMAMARCVERALASHWDLSITDGSREFLVPRGSAHTSSGPEFKRVEDLAMLGHTISSSGSTRPDWLRTRTAMWRAFFPNLLLQGSQEGQPEHTLLRKAVLPVLDFACSRWSLTPALLSDVDRVQRRMTAILAAARKLPGETPEEYVRRRARAAGFEAAKAGLWSARCKARVVKWADHFERERNREAWAAQLLQWRGAAWLQQKRLEQNSESVYAGRTGTRAAAGKGPPKMARRRGDGQRNATCTGALLGQRRQPGRDIDRRIKAQRPVAHRLH